MYFEINSDGIKIRPLPGYYDGYHADLLNVDQNNLAETQSDYLSIPLNRIIKASAQELDDWNIKDLSVRETMNELKETDLLIGRVVEDLVDLMVSKGLIAISELPKGAVDKINIRKALREKLTRF